MNQNEFLPSSLSSRPAEVFFAGFQVFGHIFNFFVWVWRELLLLYRILFSPIRGTTHQERLESFYEHQAAGYDAYREHLLHGREELIAGLAERVRALPADVRPVWVDIGGGTGANIEMMAAEGVLERFAQVFLVDLSPSLLDQARRRARRLGWRNVTLLEADATAFSLPPAAAGERAPRAHFVTFSYSLTMIPNWWEALERARELLQPGGVLGVVDFTVGRKYAVPPARQTSYWKRTGWRLFFDMDNVGLNPDHLPYLLSRFDVQDLSEGDGAVPYMPLVRAPHYRFIGTRREDAAKEFPPAKVVFLGEDISEEDDEDDEDDEEILFDMEHFARPKVE